eukprot:snap_masked-scaffold_6-processed-gene-12.13-mRNA-1 protein AED:1.00 eAED:1.00 QI:0/0/0/0/1/1/2/0/82
MKLDLLELSPLRKQPKQITEKRRNSGQVVERVPGRKCGFFSNKEEILSFSRICFDQPYDLPTVCFNGKKAKVSSTVAWFSKI